MSLIRGKRIRRAGGLGALGVLVWLLLWIWSSVVGDDPSSTDPEAPSEAFADQDPDRSDDGPSGRGPSAGEASRGLGQDAVPNGPDPSEPGPSAVAGEPLPGIGSAGSAQEATLAEPPAGSAPGRSRELIEALDLVATLRSLCADAEDLAVLLGIESEVHSVRSGFPAATLQEPLGQALRRLEEELERRIDDRIGSVLSRSATTDPAVLVPLFEELADLPDAPSRAELEARMRERGLGWPRLGPEPSDATDAFSWSRGQRVFSSAFGTGRIVRVDTDRDEVVVESNTEDGRRFELATTGQVLPVEPEPALALRFGLWCARTGRPVAAAVCLAQARHLFDRGVEPGPDDLDSLRVLRGLLGAP